MYQQRKVLITFRRGPEGHTHTHTLSSEGETDEISNTVRAVFVEDHLFLPVVLLGFFLCAPSPLIIPGPSTLITVSPTSFRQLLISSKK